MKYRSFLLLFVVLIAFPLITGAISQEEQEALWREELAQTEKDIAKWQAILNSTKANTASLQQEAAVLNAKIKKAQAFIKQRNIAIAKLSVSIKEKTSTIASLEKKIEKGHESLAQLFVEVRNTKNITEKEKASLAKQQDQQLDQKAAMALEQKKVQTDEQQKQYLIQINKTQEKTYAQVLAERQAKAAEIKAKLFRLAGGSAAIPFGTALAYAQGASAKTGVSPSFLLAILTQESNLGANVGKCYLTDSKTGAGVNVDSGKVWSNLMKATRDVQPFLEITNRLGFNAL